MATPQQPKRPAAQRKSSGNNILSRMLQMEKQSKVSRHSCATVLVRLRRTSIPAPGGLELY